MRLIGPLVALSMATACAAKADGLTAAQLQPLLAAAPSYHNPTQQLLDTEQIDGTTLGGLVATARGAVQSRGGDGSDVNVTVLSGTPGIDGVARSLKDKFGGDYDPKDYGAMGNGFVLLSHGNSPAGSKTLIVASDSRLAPGLYVGAVGVPPNATISSIVTQNGFATITLSSGSTLAAAIGDSQDIALATVDDAPAFQNAEYAAWKAGGGTVTVGRGVYYLGSQIVNHGGVGLENRGGHIYGSVVEGWGASLGALQVGAALNLGLLSNAPYSENTVYAELDMSNSNADTQKTVFSAIGLDGDQTNTGLIGYYAKPTITAGNMSGQIWAYQTEVYIAPGADGYAVALEYGIENNGSYVAGYGQPNAKLGIHAICSGPSDCTAADVVASAGGRWHYGYYVQPNSIRSDGYVLALETTTPGTFYASLDGQGNFSAQNIGVQGGLTQTVASSVVAGGVNASSATSLTAHYNRVTSCPTGGVALSSSTSVGSDLWIFNRCGSAVNVYPDTSTAQIENQGVGIPVQIGSGVDAHFIRLTSTLWVE